ncbi:tetratricopeptide repeat protein [Bradyrhizobium sp. 200]|uniref:tetratricopeptide repeat protein n=1 Tax=Bradyrhizobium sp. 200 TaxID=2782665 RepID=UPI001FFE4D09|nr:tetratricopeptide repeat protein [Bradyrhizobium sp. 200]UPJ51785.1 tetratricopeptide repeat protein [Bradyrhizobium sp. 200]
MSNGPQPSGFRAASKWLRSLAAPLLALGVSACFGAGAQLGTVAGSSDPPTASADLDNAALARLAQAAESSGNALNTANIYRRIAERQPSVAQPRIDLGRALMRNGDFNGADAAFRQALAIAPGNVDGEVGLAQVLLARQQHAEALTAFGAILERYPQNVKALNGAGIALDALGRHQEAQERYNRALAVAPEDRAARNNLALSKTLGTSSIR